MRAAEGGREGTMASQRSQPSALMAALLSQDDAEDENEPRLDVGRERNRPRERPQLARGASSSSSDEESSEEASVGREMRPRFLQSAQESDEDGEDASDSTGTQPRLSQAASLSPVDDARDAAKQGGEEAAPRRRSKRLRRFSLKGTVVHATFGDRSRGRPVTPTIERPEPLLLSESEEDESGASRKVRPSAKAKSLTSLVDFDPDEEPEADALKRKLEANRLRKRRKIALLGEENEEDELSEDEDGFIVDRDRRSDEDLLVCLNVDRSVPKRSEFHKGRMEYWNKKYSGAGTLMDPLIRLTAESNQLTFFCVMCGETYRRRHLQYVVNHLAHACTKSRLTDDSNERVHLENRLEKLELLIDGTKRSRTAETKSKLQTKIVQLQEEERRHFLLNRTVEFFLQSGISKSARNVRAVKGLVTTCLSLNSTMGLDALTVDSIPSMTLEQAVRNEELKRKRQE